MQNICHINKSSKKDEVNYKIILNHEIVEHDYESTHVSTKSKTFEITFKFLDETFFRMLHRCIVVSITKIQYFLDHYDIIIN